MERSDVELHSWESSERDTIKSEMGDDCLGKDYREKWGLGRSLGSPTRRISQRNGQERGLKKAPLKWLEIKLT